MKSISTSKRNLIAIFLGAMTALAFAGETPFDKSCFATAVAQGKPVVVEFAADWCPTCQAQKPIVRELMRESKFKDITLFVADHDK